MSWLDLALSSALCLGLYDVAKKAAVRDNSVVLVLLASTAAGWCGLVGVTLVTAGPAFALSPLLPSEHALVLLKSAVVSASWLLMLLALQHLPLSVAGPLRATAPLLTLLGAVALLGERPSFGQGCGMAIVVASYLAFAWLGRREGIHFERNRFVGFVAAATVLGAASALYDKILLQRVALPPHTLQFWFTTYNLGIQAAGAALVRSRSGSASPRFSPRLTVPLVGLLLVLADHLYFRALAEPTALVSVVSLVRRGGLLVSFFVGGLLFRERLLAPKALALGLLGVGLLLLVVG